MERAALILGIAAAAIGTLSLGCFVLSFGYIVCAIGAVSGLSAVILGALVFKTGRRRYGKAALATGGSGALLSLLLLGVSIYLAFAVYAPSTDVASIPERCGGGECTELTQSFSTKNGLVTLHYPADFIARSLDDSSAYIVRNLDDDESETVGVFGFRDPISNEPRELGRLLNGIREQQVLDNNGTWRQTHGGPAICLRKYPGYEFDSEYSIPATGAPHKTHSCCFIVGVRGFEYHYSVPTRHAKADARLLREIAEATEFELE